MQIHPRRLAPFGALAVAFALCLEVVASAPGATALVAWSGRLEAGPQTGYQFDASWNVLATTVVTLPAPLTVTVDNRRWSSPRNGAYLHLATGPLAGRWVRESTTAYVPGVIVTKDYAPAARVSFPVGGYLGYTFGSAGQLVGTKYAVVRTTSSASTLRRAVISGRPYAAMSSGTWAGYWVPLTAPTTLAASKLACSRPAKVPAGSPEVFRTLPGATNQVALTFDMGGRLTPALDILHRLIIERVCASIFPTGAMATTTTGQQVLAIIRAHPELFEVGNHTMHHCDLRDGGGGSPTTAPCPATPATASFVQQELTQAATIIRAGTSQEPAPYWRPPYGYTTSGISAAASAIGYTKTIMWTVDTIDWRPVSGTPAGPTASQIADKVVANVHNGGIALMHLGGYNTYDALPSMLARLRAAGLTPTTISDILR